MEKYLCKPCPQRPACSMYKGNVLTVVLRRIQTPNRTLRQCTFNDRYQRNYLLDTSNQTQIIKQSIRQNQSIRYIQLDKNNQTQSNNNRSNTINKVQLIKYH